MSDRKIPDIFRILLSYMCIDKTDIINTSDSFFIVNKSIANILSARGVFDFPDTGGERLVCSNFFDDWFLYAVPSDNDYTYSLLKFREQEYDAEGDVPADGDTPGVTISFISFNAEIFIRCLADAIDENRKELNNEINRVVSYKRQSHNNALKRYFKNPQSQGSYLVAKTYVMHIASLADKGFLAVPEYYKKIVHQSNLHKKTVKFSRLPCFVESLNKAAGVFVCDNENIYIENCAEPNEYETLAILATHTGNTSFYSFAAEVEYHARFLTPFSRIKIPFFGRSIYDSAIRADMTVGDTEFEGPAPFYNNNSKIVKRQYKLHHLSRF